MDARRLGLLVLPANDRLPLAATGNVAAEEAIAARSAMLVGLWDSIVVMVQVGLVNKKKRSGIHQIPNSTNAQTRVKNTCKVQFLSWSCRPKIPARVLSNDVDANRFDVTSNGTI